MIIEAAGGLISGGWDAISNITSGIGKGISRIGSTFFPAQQQARIESNTIQQANYASTPFPKSQQAATVYELYAPPPSPNQYQYYGDPTALVGPTQAPGQAPELNLWDRISKGVEWAGQQAGKIKGIADIFKPPPAPTPPNTGAKVVQMAKAGANAILDQIKGLFNLGFPQQGPQPAFGITHQVTPSPGLSTGLIVAGIILVIIVLTKGKK